MSNEKMNIHSYRAFSFIRGVFLIDRLYLTALLGVQNYGTKAPVLISLPSPLPPSISAMVNISPECGYVLQLMNSTDTLLGKVRGILEGHPVVYI